MAKKEKNQKKQDSVKEKDPLQEITELAKRTQANFENYRKQTEKRIEDIRNFANRDIISQILPILDNFELALKNNIEDNDFTQGIKLIYSQFNTILEDNDVKPIETKNQIFNPLFHEALMKVESDLPENSIVEEFQKGFLMHDQVIRHAKVKISAGKKEKEDDENKNNTKKQSNGGQ